MSLVNKWVVGACAVVAASTSVVALGQAQFRVDRQSQPVQTPATPGDSGISYSQTGATASSLRVYTDGFMFCGNPGTSVVSLATLTMAHEDDEFSPAHPWTFPPVTDLQNFAYNGGALVANPGGSTSLMCLSTRVDGSIASATREGIFDSGYDSATESNYDHLVNWTPQEPFDWTDPDWTLVPLNPCVSSPSQPARVVEDVACAAVTGVRSSQDGPVRAPTIWTSTDGVSFTYLFRVDWRTGPQAPTVQQDMLLPEADSGIEGSSDGLSVVVSDAYDSAFLSSQGGQSCTLATLPQVLNSSVCANPAPLNGPYVLKTTVAAPPVGQGYSSFYVVITRPLGQSNHALLATPAVAASTLIERAVADEGGDKFVGDNVVFGFIPQSQGFPWMSGQ